MREHCIMASLIGSIERRGWLQVPLDYVAAADQTNHFLVGVGGLISYQHMGSMTLNCSGGCSCPTIHHNMYHAQEPPISGSTNMTLLD